MPHQHHHPGHVHPPARLMPSLLRVSVWLRLLVAALLSGALWLAALWAMR